jgi:hypothetical protein
MIKNERQYRITNAQAERFKRTIADVTANSNRSLHPALRKAELGGLKSQLEDLKSELQEYELLQSGKRRTISLDLIEELPKTLIQARIAAGLSQEDLAAKLGIKPQQVQRYEATNTLRQAWNGSTGFCAYWASNCAIRRSFGWCRKRPPWAHRILVGAGTPGPKIPCKTTSGFAARGSIISRTFRFLFPITCSP